MKEFESEYTAILKKLKESGYRITNQRKIILSLMICHRDASIKELVYLVREKNEKISQASVYRTVRHMENLGFLYHKKYFTAYPLLQMNGTK
ncbi:MAG: transcriptional repressor [Treponema sp.]|nr:transcriptional repressor [Treponema sp.]